MSGEQTPPRRSIKRVRRRRGPSGRGLAIVAVLLAVAISAAAFYVASRGGGPAIVRIDGSSTVFPITSSWAAAFNDDARQVVVAFSGTGSGFQKFCRGETDLSDASRPIKASEEALCTQRGIVGVTEFTVAYDGLSVVVPLGNDWVDALTVRQLCRIWTSNTSADACGGAGPHATRWSQINASWPDRAIKLFGPGTDSGTFDYFVEVVLTPYKTRITDDFFPSEDDNVLAQAITAEPDAIGYFGFAYVVENLDRIRPVPIDDEDPGNGDGPILPTHTTIRDGTYHPLGRPLFVYANANSLARDVVRDFLRFGYSPAGSDLVGATGYVALSAPEIQTQLAKIPA